MFVTLMGLTAKTQLAKSTNINNKINFFIIF